MRPNDGSNDPEVRSVSDEIRPKEDISSPRVESVEKIGAGASSEVHKVGTDPVHTSTNNVDEKFGKQYCLFTTQATVNPIGFRVQATSPFCCIHGRGHREGSNGDPEALDQWHCTLQSDSSSFTWLG
jgi:hypothetical protein